ncbi:G protein-coupled glucose receptor regulating Gpa2-domain-containing protein [Massariosphaeria phaeospora]|uniref:G protein-coupled glucose receptor regulating Gpa2-domain-containing protein n=1 Tax=Massariosphaeria phaeospora TaxID=100035 RepID=A0A7C8I4H5_9PLEO|nr:G protein-coupled glucose receptor regulating Gpa2-domain-containing protein [Massariosphaeria phaeospora]
MAVLDMAAFEGRAMLGKRYSPYPNSLDQLSDTYRKGLIPITLCAMMSLLSVTALLVFITYRMVSWRKHYKEYVGYNQYVILIYNLLLADLQQSIAFSISFHWLRIDKILAPTAPCFLQAWFLHIGDVASGFFVLAIAIHTWLGVVKGYRMPYLWFVLTILLIWLAALILTFLGPAMFKDRFFARASAWCWVSVDYERERLYLHYLWIFIIEFGTIAIYGHIFLHLRGRIQNIMNNDTSKLSRATKFMVMYPAVYVILTLPIAVGRMVAMTGRKMPEAFFCVAGTLLTSCGWIDALLYTLTRRVFITNELSTGQPTYYSQNITALHTNAARPGDEHNYGLQSMNKEMGAARTVTIVGGSNRISRIVDQGRGRSTARAKGHPDPLREHSPTGSQDSIIKPGPNAIGIVTETNIQVESTQQRGEGSGESDIMPSRAPSRSHSASGFSAGSA